MPLFGTQGLVLRTPGRGPAYWLCFFNDDFRPQRHQAGKPDFNIGRSLIDIGYSSALFFCQVNPAFCHLLFVIATPEFVVYYTISASVLQAKPKASGRESQIRETEDATVSH